MQQKLKAMSASGTGGQGDEGRKGHATKVKGNVGSGTMTLIQQLVKKGILDKERGNALEFEVKNSGRSEEEVILAKGIAAEDFLFGLKSELLKIPLKKVAPDEISSNVLRTIPEESAKFYKMIPLFLKDNVLEVGMINPEELKAQEALKFLSRSGGFSFKVFLIDITTYKNLFKKYRSLKGDVSRALEELETAMQKEAGPSEDLKSVVSRRLAEETPISKVVAVILRHAVEGNASDIHVEPGRQRLRVRFRFLGALHSSIFLPLEIRPAVVTRIKILANLKIDEARVPQDGRFSARVGERQIDFRVSTFPTTLGEKVAIRVLDPNIGLKSFEDLGLSKSGLKTLNSAIKKPYGLILVTGPTGCGKSTTLYSVIGTLNKEGTNIVTLEDPVEYFIEGVNQSHVRPEIGYDFNTGLRHVLRQDPDIIMVGEIRDEETAGLAIHAALTGHLVLSTLHTTNALGVIPRLIDLGVKPYLLPSTLNIAVAQRLVKKLCAFCRKKTKPRKKIKELILKELKEIPCSVKDNIKVTEPVYVFEAQGCRKCNGAAFTGRVGLFEILVMTDALGDMILGGASEKEIFLEAKRQGMLTMKQDGILKILHGITTVEEVLRAAEEK